MPDRETSEAIDAQAAEWAARIDRAPLSPEEEAELDTWMAADTRRLGAYAKARAVFAHARRARALGPDFDLVAFADQAQPEAEPDKQSLRLGRRRLLWGAVAATAVVTAGGVASRWTWAGGKSVFRTARGEIRLFPLPDGSAITLNTASIVEVLFDTRRRRVRLIAGEALFDVVKDVERPFVVEAADTSVHAVGTSFTVRKLTDRPVEILVRQGVVEVARRASPSVAPLRVAANTRVTCGAGMVETAPVPAPQLTRELAWREGMLSFEDVRLDQAAAEFARYNDTRIVIDDPAVASETVTGLFAASNPAGFARAAAAALDLRADAEAGEVRLRRRAPL